MTTAKHSHYFHDVSHLQQVDIYRMLQLLDIADPALQHAFKKVAAAGKRGAKSAAQDVQEAIDSLVRWQAMAAEDAVNPRMGQMNKSPKPRSCMMFSEFEAGAMSVENIAGCRVELVGELVAVMTESYLADSDGTTVERGRGFAEMTPETFENRRPGRWLLSPFDRAIADQHQGFTRYATRDEIVKYQAAKDAQEKESSL